MLYVKQQKQNRLAGIYQLLVWLEVTHGPEMFIGVERCDIEQHTQVLLPYLALITEGCVNSGYSVR